MSCPFAASLVINLNDSEKIVWDDLSENCSLVDRIGASVYPLTLETHGYRG
jgi:hypothetical protein